MYDVDGNGIITFPEFTKMALGFCTEEELHDQNKVTKIILIDFYRCVEDKTYKSFLYNLYPLLAKMLAFI